MPKKRLFMIYVSVMIFIAAVSVAGGRYRHKSVQAISYSIGSTGEAVVRIQQRLIEWGYLSGSADGIYGQRTYDAVRLFQERNNLVPDGIVGDATLVALGLSSLQPQLTEDTIQLLARVIYGEGRGEPYEGQVAIGAVVLNRVEHPQFPDTIEEVVFQRGAFDAVLDGQINLEPDESAVRAAIDALSGTDPTGGAIYYWNPATATSRWIWTVPITTSIGRHVFGTK